MKQLLFLVTCLCLVVVTPCLAEGEPDVPAPPLDLPGTPLSPADLLEAPMTPGDLTSGLGIPGDPGSEVMGIGDPSGTQSPLSQVTFYYSIAEYGKALEELKRLSKEEYQKPQARFMKANILAQLKSWEESEAIYTDLLKELGKDNDPLFTMTRMNLAEVHYILKKYEQALKLFEKLYSENPDRQDKTVQYIYYKLFMTNLVLDQVGKAKQIMSKMDSFDSAPGYYYANAAIAFYEGKSEEAEDWIASAMRIYDDVVNNAFLEALQECGLLPPPPPSR